MLNKSENRHNISVFLSLNFFILDFSAYIYIRLYMNCVNSLIRKKTLTLTRFSISYLYVYLVNVEID